MTYTQLAVSLEKDDAKQAVGAVGFGWRGRGGDWYGMMTGCGGNPPGESDLACGVETPDAVDGVACPVFTVLGSIAHQVYETLPHTLMTSQGREMLFAEFPPYSSVEFRKA